MIPKYKGYESKKIAGPREVLPAGGYVCEIKDAKVERFDWGDKLIISYDVAEGEHKDFFRKDWANNQNPDRKWRGTLRLSIPTGDGSQSDTWSVRSFNNFAASLEESNSGYHFDWDEAKLKGKAIGILVRDREYEIEGRRGWTTEACSVTDVQSIRDGKFRMPKAKPLKDAPQTPASAFSAAEDEGDLPF